MLIQAALQNRAWRKKSEEDEKNAEKKDVIGDNYNPGQMSEKLKRQVQSNVLELHQKTGKSSGQGE